MTVSKARDFVERVGWTTIQAFAASEIVALTTSTVTFVDGLKVAGIAAAVAALKVIAAQNVGARQDGAAIPGGITTQGGATDPGRPL